jgi:hypothetical protein
MSHESVLSNLPQAKRLFSEEGIQPSKENEMKYLCLVFYDEKKRNALSDRESQAMIEEAITFDNDMRNSGHLLTAHPLHQTHTATTVRVRAGKVMVTDGPFAETNEQIGGFVVLEARDLNEAIQLASRIPPARMGGVEVRPIIEDPRLEYWQEKAKS